MNKPGIKGETFEVKIADSWFEKGVILHYDIDHKCEVIKVYNSWWRKILRKVFPFVKFKVMKLKMIE